MISRACTLCFAEIRPVFCLYLQNDRNFLIKFCSSDRSFNRNILKSLYLKFKTFANGQIAITHYYVSFTNFLTWYELMRWWWDDMMRFTLGIHFDTRIWSVNLSTWSRDFFLKCILAFKLYTVLLPNLLRPNINFIAGVRVDISSNKLHTRKYF